MVQRLYKLLFLIQNLVGFATLMRISYASFVALSLLMAHGIAIAIQTVLTRVRAQTHQNAYIPPVRVAYTLIYFKLKC